MTLSVSSTFSSLPLLQVDDLHVSFPSPQGDVEAVCGLSFSLQPGEILALVGESGSGKSVTARTLVGLAGNQATVRAKRLALQCHNGSELDLQHCSDKQWRQCRGREIGFVLQDALTSLDPLRKIAQEVAEPIITHRLAARHQLAQSVHRLLSQVGIADAAHRAEQYPHQLSGGLRQRALIASALAAQPRVLIADEPTTALDAGVQKQVLQVFKALAQAGHGVLLITHDLAVVADIADRVIVMQQGRQCESGTTSQILSAPRHPYTRQLLGAVPTADTRGQWLTGQDPLAHISLSVASLTAHSAQPVLTVDQLSLAFRLPNGEAMPAVKQVSLQLARGETLGIVGESGSGKTTLGKMILALQTPDSGNVQLLGQPWSTLHERDRRRQRARIQTIVQDPLGSFDPQFTVEQLLEQPLRLHHKQTRQARQQRIAQLLSLVNLPLSLLSRRPATLSGGQRQRVAIAQALACEPDILICDEPVSALDVTTQAQVLDLLVALQRRLQLSMLFISHDLGVVQHISARIAVMKSGEIVETGDVEQVFGQPRHPYTQMLLSTLSR